MSVAKKERRHDALPEPAELMLHRAPMLLIDRIISHDTGRLLAEVQIAADKTFFDAALGGVPTWVGIEYMAQAIAALSGLKLRNAAMGIELGMLVSCRRYQVSTPVFAAGLTLQIVVEELAGANTGMAAYRCEIVARDTPGTKLATGQLGVYQRSGKQH